MWLWNGGDSEDPTDEEDFSESLELKRPQISGQCRESGRARARRGRAMHFQISDDGAAPRAAELELDAMYDFSHFSPNAMILDPSQGSSRDAIFTKLQEQQDAMEKHMEAQEKKLSSASKALKRSRAQVQQLTAQLSMKDIDCKKLETQVTQLRSLLVEKEVRLQDVLDRQEAPSAPSIKEFHEPVSDGGGEVVELTRVTEQLTSMLKVMQRQLSSTSSELIMERRLREELTNEFAIKARAEPKSDPRQADTQERARREAIEEHLRQASAKKGSNFYPHLEV